MHVNHFAVHLKQIQHCKSTTVQYKMKNFLRKTNPLGGRSYCSLCPCHPQSLALMNRGAECIIARGTLGRFMADSNRSPVMRPGRVFPATERRISFIKVLFLPFLLPQSCLSPSLACLMGLGTRLVPGSVLRPLCVLAYVMLSVTQ